MQFDDFYELLCYCFILVLAKLNLDKGKHMIKTSPCDDFSTKNVPLTKNVQLKTFH